MALQVDRLRLAELIAARMSHDLSGTISTLAGALELAGEIPSEADEALPLAAEAADDLVHRLRLLRAAWGPAGDTIDLAGLSALASGLTGAGQFSLVTTGLPDDTVFAAPTARVLLNLLLLAREALPTGGDVTLAGAAGDVVVGIAGPRAAWPAGLARCLASESNAWDAVQDARSVQVPFTALLARAAGLRLSLLLPAGGDSLPMLRLSES